MRFFSRFRDFVSYWSGYHNNGVLCGVPGSLFGLKLFREEWQRSTLRLPGVDAFSFRVCFCNPRVRNSGKVNERGAVEEAGGLRRLRRSVFFFIFCLFVDWRDAWRSAGARQRFEGSAAAVGREYVRGNEVIESWGDAGRTRRASSWAREAGE